MIPKNWREIEPDIDGNRMFQNESGRKYMMKTDANGREAFQMVPSSIFEDLTEGRNLHLFETNKTHVYNSIMEFASKGTHFYKEFHLETVKLLLKSLFCYTDDIDSNIFGSKQFRFNGIGIFHQGPFRFVEDDLWVRTYTKMDLFDKAVSYFKNNSYPYIKRCHKERIKKHLQDFFPSEYVYWFIKNTILKVPFKGSFYEQVSDMDLKTLSTYFAIKCSIDFRSSLSIYPLNTIDVQNDYYAKDGNFFLVKSLFPGIRSFLKDSDEIIETPNLYPPTFNRGFEFQKFEVESWIGIKAHLQDHDRLKKIISGALSLNLHHRKRKMFVGKEVMSRVMTFDYGASMTGTKPLTPPIHADIIISDKDAEWLKILDSKLSSQKSSDVQEMKALEWYYRSWFEGDMPAEYGHLFSTLSALFQDTQSKKLKKYVLQELEIDNNESESRRFDLLYKIRNKLAAHPNPVEAQDLDEYVEYQLNFGDPIQDLRVITAMCLRSKVFNGTLVVDENKNIL